MESVLADYLGHQNRKFGVLYGSYRISQKYQTNIIRYIKYQSCIRYLKICYREGSNKDFKQCRTCTLKATNFYCFSLNIVYYKSIFIITLVIFHFSILGLAFKKHLFKKIQASMDKCTCISSCPNFIIFFLGLLWESGLSIFG